MAKLTLDRLERYSLAHPQEVLVVHAKVESEPDEVIVFKGFSSSLMRSTAVDLDESVLPETAEILTIDRLHGPLNPANPQPIVMGVNESTFEQWLSQAGY